MLQAFFEKHNKSQEKKSYLILLTTADAEEVSSEGFFDGSCGFR